MNFLEHGELTRIFDLSGTLCWYLYAVCGQPSVDRHLVARSICNDAQSVFLYDKVTGILKHACSGIIACLRETDNELIASQSNCNAHPVWMQANTRFTRTSCKYFELLVRRRTSCKYFLKNYKQILLSVILLLATSQGRI